MSESRWLTFEETCEELRLPPRIVRRLIRQGRLVGLVHGGHRYASEWRILDPAERYKRALAVQESLLSQRHGIDLLQFPVLSTPEFAELTGLTASSIRNFVQSGRLKPWKMGKFSLFTAAQVREFLLRRERREPRDRRVRCAALVRWCLKQLQENPLPSLSQAEVQRDDKLEGTLRRLMQLKEPERSKRVAEFWRRYELAASVARTIEKAGKTK